MSKSLRMSAFVLSVVAAGLIGGSCPPSRARTSELDGRWAVTMQDGQPMAEIGGAGTFLFEFDTGKFTTMTPGNGEPIDLMAEDWTIPASGTEYRVPTNTARVAMDGAFTGEFVIEARPKPDEPTFTYLGYSFNGSISDDGATLTTAVNVRIKFQSGEESTEAAEWVLTKQ